MDRLTLATLKLSAAKQGEQSEYYDDDAGQDGDNDHYYGGQDDDDHAEQYDEWLWWWFILTLNGFFSSSMPISRFIPDLSATDTFLFENENFTPVVSYLFQALKDLECFNYGTGNNSKYLF